MISRPKFSCGRCLVLLRPSSHTSIAGSFATSNNRSAKLPCPFAERLVLAALVTGNLTLAPGHHLGGVHRARTRHLDFAVGGGEVIVPEERHLLLQWPLTVHHMCGNAQRCCRASFTAVSGAKAPRAVTLTYSGLPMLAASRHWKLFVVQGGQWRSERRSDPHTAPRSAVEAPKPIVEGRVRAGDHRVASCNPRKSERNPTPHVTRSKSPWLQRAKGHRPCVSGEQMTKWSAVRSRATDE